ncbi:MAG: tyrosinase family protein [Micropruina sp.]|uniref:tyrosinase family protein n=1 Tax=Micropruina sp. TaxID=2737536 RepID=UPI0039E3932E
MLCRKNVAELTAAEKAELVQAFLDLKDPIKSPSRIPAAAAAVSAGGGTPNRYDDYVWLHNTVSAGAHRGPAFGPWHREFLHQIEYDLQVVSGNHHLTIPYWDWITARTSSDAGWPFTNDLLGGFGNAGPGPTTGFVTSGPFADPTTWRMNIRRSGDADLTLKRSNGAPLAGDLPTRAEALRAFGIAVPSGQTWPNVYDSAPWNDISPPTNAQVLASFRKYLERVLHDGVHVWIGGAWEINALGQPGDGGHMTFPSVSVNDPAFWLHHCNVDRLWSIWQRKLGVASEFQPQAAGTANLGHNGDDTMVNLGTAAWFAAPMFSTPNANEDHHAVGYWFHSDLPEVSLDTPSVAFGSVPELLTTFHPVQFTVRTCRQVRFELTAVTGAGFSAPAGQGIVTVEHDDHAETVTASVFVQFQASGPIGVPQAGTATVRAFIVDDDGYDAANPGDEYDLGSWVVDLSATPVTRPRAAVSLVLDRSGSMWSSAGAAGSRYDLLKESLTVLRDVMRPIDGVGVVTFDDVTAVLDGITEMGPAPTAPGSGREVLESAVASPELEPRGMTGIGQGMIDGAGVLDAERGNPATLYQQFALCVLTDGNQNQSPGVTDPPVTAAIAPYADQVYAIGLGDPGGVSDAVLTSISRYMLITGDMTAAERRFRLTKYFIQILAGVTRTAIVVDPQGDLAIGSEHTVAFTLGELDHQVDVIVLSPLAQLLDLTLVAPDGTTIDGSSGLPTVEYQQNADDVFYRLTLPVDPRIAASGEWKAVLRLPKDVVEKLRGRDDLRARMAQLRQTGTVPYSLIVQSYSDVQLDAELAPSLVIAGDKLELRATLTMFGRPFTGRARVLARVTDPSGAETLIALRAAGDGTFGGALATGKPGVYSVRFVATGGDRRAAVFQREELRTAVAYRAEIPKGEGRPEDDKRPSRDVPVGDDRDKERDERRTEEQGQKEAEKMSERKERGAGVTRAAAATPVPDAELLTRPEVEAAAQPHDHGHDEHMHHDHDAMFFQPWRLGADGEVHEVPLEDLKRDTSRFVDGRDPGVGTDGVRPAPHDHDGGGHEH